MEQYNANAKNHTDQLSRQLESTKEELESLRKEYHERQKQVEQYTTETRNTNQGLVAQLETKHQELEAVKNESYSYKQAAIIELAAAKEKIESLQTMVSQIKMEQHESNATFARQLDLQKSAAEHHKKIAQEYQTNPQLTQVKEELERYKDRVQALQNQVS